ncbi:MAG TPA: EAL domain-containing protein [Novosphingobium sp.]
MGNPAELKHRASADRRKLGRGPGLSASFKAMPRHGRAAGSRGRPMIRRRRLLDDWWIMAPAMAIAVIVAVIAAGTLPGRETLCILIGAAAMAAASRFPVGVESWVARVPWLRKLGTPIAVGGPMALFGFGIADWAASGKLAWSEGVGIVAIIAFAGASAMRRRLLALVISQTALWVGVVFAIGSPDVLGLLALGALACAVLTLLQRRAVAEEQALRRQRVRVRHRAEEILADYEQTGQGWFWETDRRGMITYVSPTILRQLGHDAAEALIGASFIELFVFDAEGQDTERTLNFHLTARSAFQEMPVRAAIPDEERWWSVSGRPIHDHSHNFLGFRGSGSDLTERKRTVAQTTRLAHYDSLTGLANRFQMSQTLEKILNAPLEDHRTCSVLLLDLDRFKQVNDTLGHPAGDALLKQVADRLKRTVDAGGVVGRLGGDEFQMILPGVMRREDLAQLAQRVIDNLSEPYLVDGHRVVIGGSVGVALSPDDGVTSEALIRNADLALYAAKDGGRGRHHFYAPDLHSEAEERRALERDLRDALGGGGLELHYQPVVHTATEKISGFEALLRWHHPQHGWLPPAKFVPIAEDAGLIAQIGEWALRTACRDLARWPEPVRVAVNVSPLQFANPALPAILTSALAAAQVAPSRLELEITESVFLNDESATEAMFAALKRVGVRLALDDFGTGYSSLGYLKKAPFDMIKIDQSFVRGAAISGSRNGAIIASIVSLAEALAMETIAEGVETLDELDLVRTLGCSHIQGYIYEKPLSAADATARLQVGLDAAAHGPRSARPVRRAMLRNVVIEHDGGRYNATIRNISATGAMIEGLWSVPSGTRFRMHVSDSYSVEAVSCWCSEDRIGIEFVVPLPLDSQGRVTVPMASASRPAESATAMRQAG